MTDGPVVAVVAAWNAAGTVGDTARALLADARVSRVVVVDDASRDATSDVARAAGADVLRLPVNVGKGGAVDAAHSRLTEADVYLLVDADLGATAAVVPELLDPVLAGVADLVIGVPPPAGRRGGLGLVRRLAATAIRRSTGVTVRAPLTGQRAVRADLLRSLDLAPGWGLETAMTLDAARLGARIVEMDVPFEHRHTGRGPAGFAHRARQGWHIGRALWSRVVPRRGRVTTVVALAALTLGAASWSGGRWQPAGRSLLARPVSHVVVMGIPRLAWSDLGPGGDMPQLSRLAGAGAVGAVNVRTVSSRPSTVEGWATLGAGTRVRADASAGWALSAVEGLEGGTAADSLVRRAGGVSLANDPGAVVVVGAPHVRARNAGKHLAALPGALGDALHDRKRRTAVVGDPSAAVAVMDRNGIVDAGSLDLSQTLEPTDLMAATMSVLDRAGVVVVAPPPGAPADRLIARLGPALRARGDTLFLAFGISPPREQWRLTPAVAWGPGIGPGWLVSRSTERRGVLALTDLAPTVLGALGLRVPASLAGHVLLTSSSASPVAHRLRTLAARDRSGARRERVYFAIVLPFIIMQAAVYLAVAAYGRWRSTRGRWEPVGSGGGVRRARWALIGTGLAVAALPLSTWVLRGLVPGGLAGVPTTAAALVGLDAGVVALALASVRRRPGPRRAAVALRRMMGATAALVLADLATGARLQVASIVGTAPQTAARWYGIGNAALAVLVTTSILWVALHVEAATRRAEALLAGAAVLFVTVLVAGLPFLGANAGSVLTLLPVSVGVVLALWAGASAPRRLAGTGNFEEQARSRRAPGVTGAVVAGAALAVPVLVLAADLARPASRRSHVGALAGRTWGAGLSPALTTAARRLSVDFRTIVESPWTVTILVVTGVLLYLLVYERRLPHLLPLGSAVRTGVVGALAAGLLGTVLEDSGAVVAALAFVYVGPLLLILAAEAGRPGPVLLPARVPPA